KRFSSTPAMDARLGAYWRSGPAIGTPLFGGAGRPISLGGMNDSRSIPPSARYAGRRSRYAAWPVFPFPSLPIAFAQHLVGPQIHEWNGLCGRAWEGLR